MNNTIFVQMASYRDPFLVPTLVELIEHASNPQHLRIVICWQHALAETIGEFASRGFSKWRIRPAWPYAVHTLSYGAATIELIDVAHDQSQGACWARNMIQQHYRNERYTLQLDSHHRFVHGWDILLVTMLESLRQTSPKPLLTTYLPPFSSFDEDISSLFPCPTVMTFDRFTPEGVVFFRSHPIQEWEGLSRPIPARFYSAHFAFADGHFAQSVQHDPQYFFHGEEISIAARAFTHGYDLYHPHRIVAWHEYTRAGRPKMWDDHTDETRKDGTIAIPWWKRNEQSLLRNRILFGMEQNTSENIDLGPYGFGTERSLAQYEYYAGISFAHRGVQQATLDMTVAPGDIPSPSSESQWKDSLRRSNDIGISLHESELGETSALDACHLSARDGQGRTLHHKILTGTKWLDHLRQDWINYRLIFTSTLDERPADYVVELFDQTGERFKRIEKAISA
ncbi:GlcNAc-transferase family protein [Paraburkholderia aspalathi]|uniref:GlcNAc-transferase family protein n=1 Tax=Paraburkholderia aspalathi TaxID=1324617 RepID=UPI0038BD4976